MEPTVLEPEVFVFGSNELGIHGGGAAKVARVSHGAVLHQGFGPQGNTFAIPTCAKPTGTPGFEIAEAKLVYYIDCFILWAKRHPEKTYKVTQIGCGLAGWQSEVVAPMFADAPANCKFDSAWEPFLPGKTFWGTF